MKQLLDSIYGKASSCHKNWVNIRLQNWQIVRSKGKRLAHLVCFAFPSQPKVVGPKCIYNILIPQKFFLTRNHGDFLNFAPSSFLFSKKKNRYHLTLHRNWNLCLITQFKKWIHNSYSGRLNSNRNSFAAIFIFGFCHRSQLSHFVQLNCSTVSFSSH